MIIELDKNEVEILETYLRKKTMRLEESGLKDCNCYIAFMSILHKIAEGKKNDTRKTDSK